MKKRLIALLMVLILTLSALPASSLAAKQMEDGVPVWTEETVKDYALQYIRGENLDTLRGYYDLQIRRYMPMETYETMLTEIEWMTGAFVQFGTYESFEEPAQKTKTHVLHLCMEKQDLDLFFTHKDKEDDWEIMAVEFVPANKQAVSQDAFAGEGAGEAQEPGFIEQPVTVGKAPYELKGILTLPEGATEPVPACVLVHGSGPSDMDETVGQTKFFADLAHAFAKKGIATLRYDKRTYTYGATMTAEEISSITVEEETIEDAISAGQLLQGNENVDPQKIVLVGHSMGAMLAPRIATEADGIFSAMLLIAGTPKTLLEIMIQQNRAAIAKLDEAQQASYNELLEPIVGEVAQLAKMKEEDAKNVTIFGVNAYYFWEMQQHDPIKLLKKLKLPTYIVQGNADFQVPVEDGVEAYEDRLGDGIDWIDYKVFRDLNHLLMKYTGDAEYQNTIQEYDTPANVDALAANNMAAWIQGLWQTNVESSEE